jgi:peptidyl-prolyl cis-trans isomerase B (cyclophilin B)
MGKRTKQEKRRRRKERQEAERRAERKRNLITVGIVAAVVLVGGVLVWASLAEEQTAGDFEDLQEPGDGTGGESDGGESDGGESDGGESDGEDGEPGEGETSEVDDRPVACGGEEPPAAGEDKPTFGEPGEVLAGLDDARARMATSCGEIVLDLDLERAPEAANSFAFLAEEGFYAGLEFHRSRPGLEVVQSGAGDNTGSWQVGYQLPAELEAAEEAGYPPGAVALAVPEGDPGAGGSQFFIVYGEAFMDAIAAGALSREYPRFATVADGLAVVQRIGEIDVGGPGGDRPMERVYIESVEIETV